jgi:hypothetical protein
MLFMHNTCVAFYILSYVIVVGGWATIHALFIVISYQALFWLGHNYQLLTIYQRRVDNSTSTTLLPEVPNITVMSCATMSATKYLR